jgi:hypothetical protein
MALALLFGCAAPTDPLSILTWTGSFEGAVGSLGLRGSAAVVSSDRSTQVGIGLREGPPGHRVQWALRLGTCSHPGAEVGPPRAYPELRFDASGRADGEAFLNQRLSPAQSYHVFVTDAQVVDAPEVAGCADLNGAN